MACEQEIPKDEQRAEGLCHICRKTPVSIGWCPLCCHWLCDACNAAWFARGVAAVKEIIRMSTREGCCGPKKHEQ